MKLAAPTSVERLAPHLNTRYEENNSRDPFLPNVNMVIEALKPHIGEAFIQESFLRSNSKGELQYYNKALQAYQQDAVVKVFKQIQTYLVLLFSLPCGRWFGEKGRGINTPIQCCLTADEREILFL